MEIKVFEYVEKLDCFIVSSEFKKICDYLGLVGWDQTAWIGRYFSLDNDYGEHWFDNWQLRANKELDGKKLNIDEDQMLFIDPERFKDDRDGPCHGNDQRKIFWTSVLKSLRLGLDVIIEEARRNDKNNNPDKSYNKDLEHRIKVLQEQYAPNDQ